MGHRITFSVERQENNPIAGYALPDKGHPYLQPWKTEASQSLRDSKRPFAQFTSSSWRAYSYASLTSEFHRPCYANPDGRPAKRASRSKGLFGLTYRCEDFGASALHVL